MIIWKILCRFSKITDREKKTLARTETVNATAVRVLKLYENDILRMAYSYLHNMEDAEDIVQETVIRYWQKAPQNMDMAKEKAWLLTVAANLSKNKIRYKKIRKTDELLDTLIQEEREDLSFVWEAVKALPVKYREVIHLFYYEGYATRDIAKILNRNESSVRSELRRGREQLKKILKEAYDFE
ncbi:RNA polymerase sigma factor [Blautia sp. MSJ-19]|uniref:RNA polymerase sigma factor n=1 Tax=Blautia sp. MSJ-19 TaxID=2841517 RepID=UPI001C0ECFD0|nr:sigma-70 family RNA polymerase sigma factor [Blautia sp. MSJ-19]MBU5482229.1 sigma-70 family RNA polymerase sigma factor [Blautia sp. MSJ-19]